MSRVLDALRTVRAREGEPWEPPASFVERAGRELRARLGREPSTRAARGRRRQRAVAESIMLVVSFGVTEGLQVGLHLGLVLGEERGS